jgi:HEAT repeat protein
MSTNEQNGLHFRGRPLSYWAEALQSADESAREEAVAAWGQIGEAIKVSAPHLGPALRGPHAAARLHGVRALRDLGAQLQAVVPVVLAALKEAALRETDDAVRTEAAEALTRHLDPRGGGSTVPALVAALREPAAAVRFGAASTLADLGGEGRAAVAALINVTLWDKDERVRVQSAVALWRIDRREHITVPVLTLALQSDDEYLRWIAADCLGDIGPAAGDAVPALRKALCDDYRAPLIRKSVALALQRIERALEDQPRAPV